MKTTVTYRLARLLAREDTVITCSGQRKIVAGRTMDATHVNVTFVGGSQARYEKEASMKIIAGNWGQSKNEFPKYMPV